MHILYYSWEENCKTDMLDTLSRMGISFSLITCPQNNYLYNPPLEELVFNAISECHCDFLFSFNYLPVLSEAANHAKTPYVSWVYDCPHWTLFSPTISYAYNYIFLFDQNMVQQVKQNGALHAFHLPLAVNIHRLNNLLNVPKHSTDVISFVGSLYEQSPFQHIEYLPDWLHGYLDGIMNAQKQVWGQDLLFDLLTPEIIKQLDTYIKYEDNALYPLPHHLMYLSMLQTELTRKERIEYLNKLSTLFPVTLYSTSAPELCPAAIHKGFVHYTTQMPFVFAQSKINLNFSLRSITSGIPLRALDIMGCGGFLLTNYQPELDYFFTNGTEYVYFESQEDLCAKAEYYLSHEKERIDIAQNGLSRIAKEFSYEHQIQQILSLL